MAETTTDQPVGTTAQPGGGAGPTAPTAAGAAPRPRRKATAPRQRTRPRAPGAAPGPVERADAGPPAAGERALTVPVLVPSVHVHRVPVPRLARPHVPDAVSDRLPAGVVPAGLPRRVLWWGGLAGLALADVITWPVAAVVGAATYVAGREAAASRQDTVAAAAAAGAAAAAALTAGQGAAPATPDAGEQGRI